jgi:hypothetical protein
MGKGKSECEIEQEFTSPSLPLKAAMSHWLQKLLSFFTKMHLHLAQGLEKLQEENCRSTGGMCSSRALSNRVSWQISKNAAELP